MTALYDLALRYNRRLELEKNLLELMGQAIREELRRGSIERIKPDLLVAAQETKQARAQFFTLLNSMVDTAAEAVGSAED